MVVNGTLISQEPSKFIMVCSHLYYRCQSQQTTILSETAQESGGALPTTSPFLRHSNSSCPGILLPSLALGLCHRSITGWTVGVDTNACYLPSFILLRGACHILTYCSSLHSLPSNSDVTNFQGHSFKISSAVTHPLPFIIYCPLHVTYLSCLDSEQPHG